MERNIFDELKKWKEDPRRKPLLIRGARQVGKTFIIRELGKHFPGFVELNFELLPGAKKVFDRDLEPHRIIRDLALFIGKKITPGSTLLFFDEIQEAPKTINALRYFHEMLPEQHVIAAGSLLEFELENIGLPVGRVSSIYMYPLSFMEFLKAKNEELLIETLINHDTSEKISEVAHRKLLILLGEYMTVGGMPEAVECFIETSDLNQCFKIHRTIIDTYRQDFNKYANKYQLKYVELLFNSIPTLMGKKFKYSNIPGEYRKRELMPCLDLLVKAGIVNKITYSSGQGIPLAATAKEETFKTIFLDIALSQTILGVVSGSWLLEPEKNFINKGELTEALVGQEMLAYSMPDWKSELYYWHREARTSNAEVDYLIQEGDTIIPVEVKSGSTGTLRSLRLFLESHQRSPYGIRFSVGNFSIDNGIHNYPLYAVVKLFGVDSGFLCD
ncbi:MAG: ATP-binding protein [Candidatus Aminicenantes bacterium]|nr:MAG: ATP-binding protein [Candidatus Aminicenantes bacterium]